MMAAGQRGVIILFGHWEVLKTEVLLTAHSCDSSPITRRLVNVGERRMSGLRMLRKLICRSRARS